MDEVRKQGHWENVENPVLCVQKIGILSTELSNIVCQPIKDELNLVIFIVLTHEKSAPESRYLSALLIFGVYVRLNFYQSPFYNLFLAQTITIN